MGDRQATGRLAANTVVPPQGGPSSAVRNPPERRLGRAMHSWLQVHNAWPCCPLVPHRGLDNSGIVDAEPRQVPSLESLYLFVEQVEAQVAEWRSRLEGSGLFPRLVGLLRQGIDPDAAETRDERFEFGLTCVLDGVAARVESSRGNRPDRS